METNKKQTALSWLKDQIIDNKDIYIEGNTLMIPNDIFRKAQQIEREQIEQAHHKGFVEQLNPDEYYEQTYGK